MYCEVRILREVYFQRKISLLLMSYRIKQNDYVDVDDDNVGDDDD